MKKKNDRQLVVCWRPWFNSKRLLKHHRKQPFGWSSREGFIWQTCCDHLLMSCCTQVKQFEASISLPGLCLSISITPRHTSHLHPPPAHPPHHRIVQHDAAFRKLPSFDVMRMCGIMSERWRSGWEEEEQRMRTKRRGRWRGKKTGMRRRVSGCSRPRRRTENQWRTLEYSYWGPTLCWRGCTVAGPSRCWYWSVFVCLFVLSSSNAKCKNDIV